MSRGYFSKLLVILFALALFLGVWLYFPNEFVFSGTTMGTTYSVRAYGPKWISANGLDRLIAARLQRLTDQMSTYLPTSEISRFNAAQSTEPFRVSREFYQVLMMSKKVFALCHGYWDPTIQPLSVFWQDIKESDAPSLPARAAVLSLKESVGFDQIRLLANNRLQKLRPSIQLDLSSIAKGYAVDEISDLLVNQTMTSFFIEIGGEIRVKGRKPNKQPWRIGISQPVPNADPSDILGIVALTNEAMATSGDYRNFFMIAGQRYSHILDPHTGFPVTHNVVSVSVISNSCGLSDGLATGIMVMGPDKGKALLTRLKGVEGMIVVRTPDGAFKQLVSPGFPELAKMGSSTDR